ncbi:MAG: hypothetical protein CfClM3_1307 [Methanobrevibacter sp. CfCl-M3]
MKYDRKIIINVIIVIAIILIISTYGYSAYKYNENIKEIDNVTYKIKDRYNNFSNNDTDSIPDSMIDRLSELKDYWINESASLNSTIKKLNETKAYTFFDQKKNDHLNKCSTILDTYNTRVQAKIEVITTALNIVKTTGLLGLFGIDINHYDKIFNETQQKINSTSI